MREGERERSQAGLSREALRLWLGQAQRRFQPSERQWLFALTVVIGGICGLAAVGFHLLIDLVARLTIAPALAAPGRHRGRRLRRHRGARRPGSAPGLPHAAGARARPRLVAPPVRGPGAGRGGAGHRLHRLAARAAPPVPPAPAGPPLGPAGARRPGHRGARRRGDVVPGRRGGHRRRLRHRGRRPGREARGRRARPAVPRQARGDGAVLLERWGGRHLRPVAVRRGDGRGGHGGPRHVDEVSIARAHMGARARAS